MFLKKITDVLMYLSVLSITFWIGFIICASKSFWYFYQEEVRRHKTFFAIAFLCMAISIINLPLMYIVSIHDTDESQINTEISDMGYWTKQYYVNLYNVELYGNGLCKYGYADVDFSDNIVKSYQIYLEDNIIDVEYDNMISLIFLDEIDHMSKFQFETPDCDSIYEIQFIKEK